MQNLERCPTAAPFRLSLFRPHDHNALIARVELMLVIMVDKHVARRFLRLGNDNKAPPIRRRHIRAGCSWCRLPVVAGTE